jgi:hypothetical protein
MTLKDQILQKMYDLRISFIGGNLNKDQLDRIRTEVAEDYSTEGYHCESIVSVLEHQPLTGGCRRKYEEELAFPGGGIVICDGKKYGLREGAYYYGKYEYTPGFGAECYAGTATELETGRLCSLFWRVSEDWIPDEQEEDSACNWDIADYVRYED